MDATPQPEPYWTWNGRIPCLDGLRAISIVLVLFAHIAHTRGFPLGDNALFGQGAIGVDVFFAISGFLITLLLLRERKKSGTISLRGFYRRRVLRIVPAYLAFLLVIFCLTQFGGLLVSKWDWASALTYTVNFRAERPWEIGHLWSLSIEEQFYLIWPFLMLTLPLKSARNVAGGYLVIAPFLRLGVYLLVKKHLFFSVEQLKMVDSWTFTRADSIAIGCLMALALVEPSFRQRVAPFLLSAPKWLLFFTLGLAVSLTLSRYTLYALSLGYSVNAVCIAAIIYLCIHLEESSLGKALQSKAFVFMGLISYSLYLWQQIFLDKHSSSWLCAWPQNVLFVLVAGICSYFLVETPFLKLKK